MGHPTISSCLAWVATVLAAAAALAATPEQQADRKPADTAPAAVPAADPADRPDEPETRKLPDLGPPLVADADGLIRLDVNRPLWFDKANKRVVMIGRVCQRNAPLEMFACLAGTKEHESVVSIDVEAYAVHAALLVAGAKPGHPAKWDPVYAPATGTQIDVTVVWKDKDGKRLSAPAQDWVQDVATKKAMAHTWVFAGSGLWKNEDTGEDYYLAEGGDFICVSNFPGAMLDLPVESSQANEALLFRAFAERIPPLGTPVTVILTPKLEEKKDREQESGKDKPPK